MWRGAKLRWAGSPSWMPREMDGVGSNYSLSLTFRVCVDNENSPSPWTGHLPHKTVAAQTALLIPALIIPLFFS